MEFLTDPQLLIAFLTLTALELVLGIDRDITERGLILDKQVHMGLDLMGVMVSAGSACSSRCSCASAC